MADKKSDAAKLSTMKFRRRDMLEAEKVAGVPMGKMFIEETEPDGSKVQIATAVGSLAMQYVIEKRSGVTELDFDDWLDEESDEFEIEVADPS